MEREAFNGVLAQKRIILLDGEITEAKVNTVKYWLLVLNLDSEKEIRLIIDSEGGDVEAGLQLFDAVKLSRAPVTGIVIGKCQSIALAVLQGCKKRLATKHSVFMSHHVRPNIELSLDENFRVKIERALERAEKSQECLIEVLCYGTRRTAAEIEELMKDGSMGNVFLADKALVFNLIDQIITKDTDNLFNLPQS